VNNTTTTNPHELPPNGSLLADLDYLNEARAAIALNVGTPTLIGYRKAGVGPKFTLIGRRVFYSRTALKEWLEAGGTLQTDDPPRKLKAKRPVAANLARRRAVA